MSTCTRNKDKRLPRIHSAFDAVREDSPTVVFFLIFFLSVLFFLTEFCFLACRCWNPTQLAEFLVCLCEGTTGSLLVTWTTTRLYITWTTGSFLIAQTTTRLLITWTTTSLHITWTTSSLLITWTTTSLLITWTTSSLLVTRTTTILLITWTTDSLLVTHFVSQVEEIKMKKFRLRIWVKNSPLCLCQFEKVDFVSDD